MKCSLSIVIQYRISSGFEQCRKKSSKLHCLKIPTSTLMENKIVHQEYVFLFIQD